METYIPKGVCARSIEFEIEDDIIKFVKFNGGCPGNSQAVSKLCIGRTVDEVISLLEGIQCRNGTSCPDQFSQALKAYKETH